VLRLYLLRHGIPQQNGPDPALSSDGIDAMEAAARGMTRLGISFDLILTSPLKRAEQTARIVASVAGPGAPVRIESPLVGGCTAEMLLNLVAANRSSGSVLVVGHQPDMGRIAADLTGADGPLPFGRGTLCCLEIDGPTVTDTAALVFLMPADLLAKAG